MITFKKFGKTVKIRNDDWKKLKERFDADRAKWVEYRDGYFISVACSLCKRYQCGNCPFNKFADNYGCTEFLDTLFKPRRFKVGGITVSWFKQQNKLARKQLGQILKMMDKIEKSQGGKNDKESKD